MTVKEIGCYKTEISMPKPAQGRLLKKVLRPDVGRRELSRRGGSKSFQQTELTTEGPLGVRNRSMTGAG